MKIVIVTWLDSVTASGWEDKDFVPDKPVTVETMGFLHTDGADHVIVAQSRASNGQFCSYISIPREAILSIKGLTVLERIYTAKGATETQE